MTFYFQDNLPEIDTTELPWNPVEVPVIPTGRFGKWEITEQNIPLVRGYFRGLQVPGDNYALTDRESGEVWMSITPMELESMAPHVHGAHGTVVVVGAGLGVYLFNVLKKPDVERVFLIERDPDILDLLIRHMRVADWEGGEKLTIIEADALELDPQVPDIRQMRRADFMFVDIWSEINSRYARPMTMIVQGVLDAKVVAFWTQELEFISWLHEQGRTPPPTSHDWDMWLMEWGLPVHTYTDVAFWSLRAAEQVVQY